MYLVGHAIVAFLLAYALSKKFRIGEVSFALAMLIACLPDVDVLFQSAGILLHKSYTHSLILSLIAVPIVIFAIAKWRKVSAGAAFVYSMAYIQHIAIGDIAIGSMNILYPFGDMIAGSGIGYGTLVHQVLEFLLLAIAAAIVLGKSFGSKEERPDATILFRYNRNDQISYLLLIGSLTISFVYLLYGIKVLPRFYIETNLELTIFVLLHLSTIAWMSFMALVAMQHTILARNSVYGKS